MKKLLTLFTLLLCLCSAAQGAADKTFTLTGSSSTIANGKCSAIDGAYVGRRGSGITMNSTYGVPTGGGTTATVFAVSERAKISIILDNQQTSAKSGTIKLASVTDAYYTDCTNGTLGSFPSESQTLTVSFAKNSDSGEQTYTFDEPVTSGKYMVFWSSGINGSIYLKKIELTNSPATYYSVTHNLSNISRTSGATGASAATSGVAYNATFTANSGYVMPTSISVTIGGEAATAGTDYTWNSETGAFQIPGAKVTGAIVITISGTPTYNVSHSLSNASAISGATGASAATSGVAYNATFTANSGYGLPPTISVTIGGDAATAGTDYTWNSETGALQIPGAKVTGAIIITINGLPAYNITYNPGANGTGSIPDGKK